MRWLFVLSGCPQRLLRGRESEVQDTGCHSVFRDVWRGIRAMPRGMARVCIIQVGKRNTLCCRPVVGTQRGSTTRLVSTCRITTTMNTCTHAHILTHGHACNDQLSRATHPTPLGLGQAFTWFSWFCFFPIVSDWMGMAVYRGKASCDCASGPQACIESKCQFNRGIAMAGIGLMAKAGTWAGRGGLSGSQTI